MSYTSAQALLNRGVSRPTLYSVQLPVPFINRQTNDYINFFCNGVTIPEVRASTLVITGQENMGIDRHQPTMMTYGKPLTISVIENSDFSVYKDLRSWMDRTVQNSNQVGSRNQRMTYYDTYTADMDIIKLEFSNNPEGILGDWGPNSNYKEPFRVRFINAYPKEISPISLSSDKVNEFTTYTIAFDYESYQFIDNTGAAVVGQLISTAASLFGF